MINKNISIKATYNPGLTINNFYIMEYARLQGFPDDFHFEEKRSSYRLIGNAVPIQMGEWVGKSNEIF